MSEFKILKNKELWRDDYPFNTEYENSGPIEPIRKKLYNKLNKYINSLSKAQGKDCLLKYLNKKGHTYTNDDDQYVVIREIQDYYYFIVQYFHIQVIFLMKCLYRLF